MNEFKDIEIFEGFEAEPSSKFRKQKRSLSSYEERRSLKCQECETECSRFRLFLYRLVTVFVIFCFILAIYFAIVLIRQGQLLSDLLT